VGESLQFVLFNKCYHVYSIMRWDRDIQQAVSIVMRNAKSKRFAQVVVLEFYFVFTVP